MPFRLPVSAFNFSRLRPDAVALSEVQRLPMQLLSAAA
jgi:hypothetical protein